MSISTWSLNFHGSGGAGQRIDIANPPTITTDNPWSLTGWIKPNTPVSNYASLATLGQSFGLFFRSARRLNWIGAGGADILSSPITDLVWTPWALTMAADRTFNMYLGGALDAGFPTTVNNSFMEIDRMGSDANSEILKAWLDEIRFYNVELTPTEVSQHATGVAITRGLINYWAFEEGTGTLVNDSIGTSNGTINDATNITWDTDVPSALSQQTSYPAAMLLMMGEA